MGFIGVYRATYDYAPQAEGELELQDGDLLFVLEKGDDDWWKAKKKAPSEDEEEPEGLIPNNYVEEATPIGNARALYDYTRQTDEEISLTEEAEIQVYDASDEDWTLVGYNGEFGFAPSNYIEMAEEAPPTPARPAASRPVPIPQPEPEDEPEPLPIRQRVRTPSSDDEPTPSPAAALAGIIQSKSKIQSTGGKARDTGAAPARRQVQFTPEASDEEAPPPGLPQRPPSLSMSPPARPTFNEPAGVMASPPQTRPIRRGTAYEDDAVPQSPRGFHIYNIYEMVEVMGRSKKMPITLGINVGKGVIMISPEQSRDAKEWTADKLTHYAQEGKHIFMELVRPSKSVDFHAGQKDTAQEIMSHLGELAGAAKAAGLKEVMAAGSGENQQRGKVLYDFMAAGDDEVTCAADDEVVILDDTNDEWWLVRRITNGKRGVVPSNYVEVTGTVSAPSASAPPTSKPHVSFVEQNRREEEKLAKQAAKSRQRDSTEVGSGQRLPQRNSSLALDDNTSKSSQKSGKRDVKDGKSSEKKSLPDKSRCRTWTDRTASFKVEAEFLGLKEGKIHLHKLNGVKIAVPVAKMSLEDLEYVERATGVSLDEDKPLSDIKRKNTQRDKDRGKGGDPRAGASIGADKAAYDWFDFFLACGVNPQICERYASAFSRDQMGEENIQDISPQLLRTLGLKEGDILRVMKHLDTKFGRLKNPEDTAATDANGAAGLFSGPGGALRNNTRKGRPAPPVQTLSSAIVDARAFEPKASEDKSTASSQPKAATPLASAPARAPKADLLGGFDDNAWEPRESKSQATAPAPQPTPAVAAAPPAPAAPPPPTGNMADLSLLSPPLQPEKTGAASPPAQQPAAPAQPSGATPSLFEQLAKSPANAALNAPARAASAPQNQPSAFNPPPLQSQMTGYQSANILHAQPVAPGQSMDDQLLTQRLQQQQRLMQQQTGFQPTNFMPYGQQPGLLPQQTGFMGQQQLMPGQQQQFPGFMQPQQTGYQPMMQQGLLNGQQTASPFADPPRPPFQPQPTGFQNTFNPTPLQPQQTGINAFLPPALVPQPTGMAPQPSFGGPSQFNQAPPPVPPIPQQNQYNLQPLVAQKTGPPPPVRFGVGGAKKLAPQPTGKRANLAAATPQNPFGF